MCERAASYPSLLLVLDPSHCGSEPCLSCTLTPLSHNLHPRQPGSNPVPPALPPTVPSDHTDC